jgi:hypothetical protein
MIMTLLFWNNPRINVLNILDTEIYLLVYVLPRERERERERAAVAWKERRRKKARGVELLWRYRKDEKERKVMDQSERRLVYVDGGS